MGRRRRRVSRDGGGAAIWGLGVPRQRHAAVRLIAARAAAGDGVVAINNTVLYLGQAIGAGIAARCSPTVSPN